ncbi:hypothetical protein QSI_3196 [Clostridioides difficile P28]|nr:hypothetical protein QSI_3196 [Clostridioides difficile P28]
MGKAPYRQLPVYSQWQLHKKNEAAGVLILAASFSFTY